VWFLFVEASVHFIFYLMHCGSAAYERQHRKTCLQAIKEVKRKCAFFETVTTAARRYFERVGSVLLKPACDVQVVLNCIWRK